MAEPVDKQEQQGAQELAPSTQAKIAPGVRLVAFGLDFLACYLIAVFTTVIPFLKEFLPYQTVMLLLFLTRDFPFGGRGFGKNLMGLRVVDAVSEKPASLKQSVLRNIIFIAPFIAFQITNTIMSSASIPWLDSAVMKIVNLICTAYVLIVLPLESYRALGRPDGLRKGDELAGTVIAEAATDFKHFLPPSISS